MTLTEGTLCFNFGAEYQGIKYDDSKFYRNYFNCFDSSKGLDFIADSKNQTLFIEVKNCLGHEAENAWRTQLGVDKTRGECFDVEVTKKIAMTLAALYGAYTKNMGCEAATELLAYHTGLSSRKIPNHEKKIHIFLFLEGQFKEKSRTKKAMMTRIQNSIRHQLKWLQCSVHVEDSTTINGLHFSVTTV